MKTTWRTIVAVVAAMGASAAWAQRSTPVELGPAAGAAGDFFGSSVAIAGDTAIVGASSDDVGANANQGSAHVYRWTGSGWVLEATLTAAGGAADDFFGASVAIAGDTAIVGAYADDLGANANQGSAYVFTRTGSTWTQQAQLTAADGAADDYFAASVAISGNTVIVGAFYDNVGANADQGSAYVFTRTGSAWTQQAHLTATGGAADDLFGYSVAISGDTAIVGAYLDDVGANGNQGSAYVFTRTGSTWSQQVQLAATGGTAGDIFGVAVAIAGDTAIVGASGDDVGSNANQGSAYVFTRTGSAWMQQAQLTATGGATSDSFGTSVAISGDTAIVGASFDDVGANANQGAAHVFMRSGSVWTQQAQLTHAGGGGNDLFGDSVAISGDTAIVGAYGDDVGANLDQGSARMFSRVGSTWIGPDLSMFATGGAAGDDFGYSVAISGDTAIVGAYSDDVGASVDQGSAYVFTRTGSTWTQQAQLTATGGAAGDFLGGSVAISGNTVIVGAFYDNVGANVDQGSAYVFTRTGSTWTQQAQLTATGGAAGDIFGVAVAISGDTAIVGAYFDDVGANVDQGSAWTFDVATNDFASAYNDVTGVASPSLAAAMLSAASGQQITATEAAWRNASILDTAGRSIIFVGRDDIRTPPLSVITLGGSSSMQAPAGAVIDLNGQLRVNGYGDLYADAFRLGSRGIITSRTNASLTINAPTAELDGQTRLEQGSSLTFAGTAEAIGSTTCAFGSTLTAGTSFTNIDTFTITAGTINTPLFWNRAQFNVFGTSAIFGNLLNNVLATTTIRSGTLFVFGDLTNNGTVIGTICSTCSGLPPSMDVGGTLSLGSAANLTMPFVGSTVHLGGSFDCAINANTRFDMALSTLQLQSPRPEVTLEVMSRDIGVDAMGLDRSRPGHFPIGELHIGGSPTTVRLVDAHDNALDGTGACEALYVDTLRIDAGSRLINTTCRIYYNTLVNGGTVDVPANLIPLQGTPCPADFNMDGGVDGGDVVDFFVAWEGGDSMADVNQDGGVDGGDIDVFFAAWEAGGC